jgi:hypothetical protein
MNKKSILAMSVAAALSSMALSPIVVADNTTAVVRGTVQDGAGTTVEVVDTSRGVSRSYDITDGRFQFRSLQPGTYEVRVVRDGNTVDTQIVTVALGGEANVVMAGSAQAMEEVVVMGERRQAADTALAEQGIVISAEDLALLPVARDLNSVALLAPGVSRGDNAFGSNVSFSGSSVAENTTYVNGLNITNFRNGLGFSEVPFEAYSQFEVKSGGYGAKYGRSTGGVINAIIKSGTNDFQVGASAYLEKPMGDKEETYASNTARNTYGENNFNIFASGALIEDRLFFYALAQQKEYDGESYGKLSGRAFKSSESTTFWLANLQGYITDNHRIELLAFNDEADFITDTFEYDYPTDTLDANLGQSINSTGGMNWVATYVGQLTNDLELQVKVGENEQNRTSLPATAVYPVVYNYDGGFQAQGLWTDFTVSEGTDTRKMARVDLSWDFGDHFIEAGFDYEKNTTIDQTVLSGGAYYLKDPTGVYNASVIGSERPNYRLRTYNNGGSFDVETSALYLSDTWRVTDNVTLELGVRNETFTNFNANGEEFISMENQWAPRFAARWDVNDRSNVFATLGMYYLPVASNTNARLSGGETYIHEYFAWDGVSVDPVTDAPINGGALLETVTFADGSVPDTRSLTDVNIEPMYQSEIMLGYQYLLNDEWTLGVTGVYRELQTSIEDVAIDAAVIDYYNSTGSWDSSLVGGSSVEEVFTGFHQYVLTNPGNDMTVYIPEMEEFVDLTKSQLGYPDAERKYTALEFSFARDMVDNWTVSGSYVLASSEGNNEGYVRSDNGQDDAGLTTNFDQPGLTDFAYGKLPNDRLHTFKAYGLYQLDMGLNLSANFVFQTGRPKNCFGIHPTDAFAAEYGDESFYCYNPETGVSDPSPRGSKGRTDNVYSLDLGASYTFDFNHSELRVGLDVFNVFHNQAITEVNESEPRANEYYGLPTSYQRGRSARFSVNYLFH